MLLDRQLWPRLFIVLVMSLLAGCASAGEGQSLASMLIHLQSSYPNLWRMVTAGAYVIGFYFAYKGVMAMKVYGEMRTMMSNNTSLKPALTYFLVAAALMFSPTTFQVLNATVFGSPDITPISYAGHLKNWSHASTVALLGLVQFIGLLAFIRGWLYIAKAGDQGGQQGQFGKGLTHIIGGLLAINIMGAWNVISASVGFS